MDQSSSISGQLQANSGVSAEQRLSNAFRQEEFDIKLRFFEGPMDLLLHLVQQREVSIEEVEMTELAEQYLEIVTQASSLDLDRAAEYLVIAATLIALKSQILLPSEKLPNSLEDLPDDVDPEYLEELRARIRDYEITKKQARFLSASPQLGVDTFARRGKTEVPPEVEDEDIEVTNDGTDLGRMFVKLLNRVGETIKSYRVKLEPINVVKMMMSTLDTLKSGSINSFTSLLKINSSGGQKVSEGAAKSVVIGSFISVLELMKRGLVSAVQESNRGEIRLSLKMLEADEKELEQSLKEESDVAEAYSG